MCGEQAALELRQQYLTSSKSPSRLAATSTFCACIQGKSNKLVATLLIHGKSLLLDCLALLDERFECKGERAFVGVSRKKKENKYSLVDVVLLRRPKVAKNRWNV